MNGKVMPVRIVPMKTEHLDAVAELERSCFTVPWSRNALAEELDNALSAFLVAVDENDRVVAAISLYGQHGYRGVGRRRNYYEHPKEDAVIMTREFGEAAK